MRSTAELPVLVALFLGVLLPHVDEFHFKALFAFVNEKNAGRDRSSFKHPIRQNNDRLNQIFLNKRSSDLLFLRRVAVKDTAWQQKRSFPVNHVKPCQDKGEVRIVVRRHAVFSKSRLYLSKDRRFPFEIIRWIRYK